MRRTKTVETGWLRTIVPEPSNAQGQDWAALPMSLRLSVYHTQKKGRTLEGATADRRTDRQTDGGSLRIPLSGDRLAVGADRGELGLV